MTSGSLPVLEVAAACRLALPASCCASVVSAGLDRVRCAVGAGAGCLPGGLKKQSYQRLLHAR